MISNDEFKINVDLDRYNREQRRKKMMARMRKKKLRRKRRIRRTIFCVSYFIVLMFLVIGFTRVLFNMEDSSKTSILESKSNIVLADNIEESSTKKENSSNVVNKLENVDKADDIKSAADVKPVNNKKPIENKTVENNKPVENNIFIDNNEPGSIYLTFDDGPSSNVTEEVLDILAENDIKATFFVVDYDDSKVPLLRRMINEGHTIGIHTASHNYSECYSNDGEYLNGIDRIKVRLKEDLGYDAYCIRFPGGSSNTVSKKYNEGILSRLSDKVGEKGFEYFDWNVDSGDASGSNVDPDVIEKNIENALNINRMNIILMHDTDAKETTAASLHNIIDYGKKNSYVFKAIAKNTNPVHHRINN